MMQSDQTEIHSRYKFNTLKEITHSQLHKCFSLAFSDYALPMALSETELIDRLVLSGVDYDLSYGAFYDEQLIGFIINSSEIYKGEKVVFDIATAITPEHRGQKVFARLFDYCISNLDVKGITKYYLEVLKENKNAIDIYTSKGFETVREYAVLKFSDDFIWENKDFDLKCSPLKEFDKRKLSEMISPVPSYEHSSHILERNIEQYKVIYLLKGADISAYTIISIAGQIMEVGYTDLSYLKQILQKIMSEYKTVSAKNIDMDYPQIIELLISLGFGEITQQYEMCKNIVS